MENSHEEADSKVYFNAHTYNIFLHLNLFFKFQMITHLASVKEPAHVVLRSWDTDVLVIALANCHLISDDISIYMEVGIASKNSLCFIDVSSLYGKLGTRFAKSLPGFHSFTGCDQNPAFSRKEKVRPLAILEKSLLYQDAFSSLGTSEKIDEKTISTIGLFVCEMYGFKKHTENADQLNVDDAKLQMFSKVYQSGPTNPMSKVKGLDGSSLPPCKPVLFQQILCK